MFGKEIQKLQGFKKAYVQRLNGEYVNDASFYYTNGLRLLNIPIEFFDEDKPHELELDRETLVVAGVPTTLEVFRRLGIEPPLPLDIPKELVGYCGRMIQQTTIRKVLDDSKEEDEFKFPLFVKPASHGKLFNGQVVYGKEELKMFRYCHDELDLDIPIIVSEPVKFLAEYRSFVLEGNIIDCRKYMGHFSFVPDFKIIQRAVRDYTTAPIAYSIDFGVTDDGRTLLVECNDAYSLGPYGFDNFNLTKMFIMRWKEIIGKY